MLIMIPLAIVLLGAFAAFGVLRQRTDPARAADPGAAKVSAAELGAIALSEPKERVAARFGKRLREGNSLDFELSDSQFGRASFTWETSDHVTRVMLWVRQGDIPADVIERLRAQLGRALEGSPASPQFSVEGVTLSTSSAINISAHKVADPRYKARITALWTAVKHAAFGSAPPIDLATRRDVLNLDYDLGDVAKLDPATTVDRSESAMRAIFPGSVSSGTWQSIGLDHPWFRSVGLNWKNERGGQLHYANLHYMSGTNAMTDVQSCLEPLLGKAQVQETDHVAKAFNLDWRAKNGFPRVHVTNQLTMIFLDASGSARARPAEWRRVLARLAECGRTRR